MTYTITAIKGETKRTFTYTDLYIAVTVKAQMANMGWKTSIKEVA